MKQLGLVLIIALISLQTVAQRPVPSAMPTQDFLGVWEVGKNPVKHTANITINIQRSGETLGGSMVFLNPDSSVIQAAIIKVSIDGSTLAFETMLDKEPFYWSLTVNKDKDTALLKGHQHEMLIEEEAAKKK